MKELRFNVQVDGENQLKNLNKEVEKLDTSTKEATDSTKTFGGTLKDATSVTNKMPGSLGKISRSFSSMGSTIQGINSTVTSTIGRLGALRVALIATGIGAIAVLLGTLAAAFFSTQEGVDALNRVLTPVSFVFQRLLGIAQELGRALMQGNFMEFIRIIRGSGSELRDAAQAGLEYADAQVRLEESVINSIVPLAELSVEYEKNRRLLQDSTQAVEDRIEAGQRSIQNIKDDIEIRRDLIEQEIRQLEIEQGLNDTNREGNEEYQRLRASLIELEAEEEKRIVRIERTTASLQQQQEREEQQRQQRLEQEREAQLQEELREEERLQRRLERERLAQAELRALRTQELEDEIEFRRIQMEQELMDEELTESERLLIQERFQMEELQLKQAHEDELTKLKEQEERERTRIENEEAEARKQLAEAEAQAKIDLQLEVASTMMSITRLIGEQTALGKALSVASATIDTYVGANKALAQGGIFGTVAAAGIIATGLANVRQILSTKVPSIQGQPLGTPAASPLSAPRVQAPDVGPQGVQTVETVFGEELNVNASVSVTEIEETRNRVRVIEEGAEF